MNVAIVGLSQSGRDSIPFNQDGWEVWGMPQDNEHWVRFDRVFDPHNPIEVLEAVGEKHIERLQDIDSVLYMQYPGIEHATPYPFDKVGTKYMSSTIGYMLALAIAENVDEIMLIGVDMADDTEYRHQRANCEYFIGFARGKGIKVTIPDESPVCKYQGEFDGRYGWRE